MLLAALVSVSAVRLEQSAIPQTVPMPKMPIWTYIHTRQRPAPAEARGGHTATLVINSLYIWGGCDTMGNCYNDMVKLDVDMMTWSRPFYFGAQNPPSRREGHSATAVGTLLYYFGGYSPITGMYMNDLYTYDTATNSWNKTQTIAGPSAREKHTATLMDEKRILFFGGYSDSAYYNDINVLDTENLIWYVESPTGVLPHARMGHTANLLGDKLYVFGGYSGTNPLQDLNVLDLRSMQWYQPSVGGTLPPARQHHAANIIGSTLYIWGGCDYIARSCYQTLFTYDIDMSAWKQADVDGFILPPARESHTLTLDGTKMFLFGGCLMDQGCMSDIFSLETSPCPNQCSGHGDCFPADGVCQCYQGYREIDCSMYFVPTPGQPDQPCPNACSYRGECVDGVCQCDTFFTSYDCSVANVNETGYEVDCGNDMICIQARKARLASLLERQQAKAELRRAKQEAKQMDLMRQQMDNLTKLENDLKAGETQRKMPRIYIKNAATSSGGGGCSNGPGPPGVGGQRCPAKDEKSREEIEALEAKKERLKKLGKKYKPGCPMDDGCFDDDDDDLAKNVTKAIHPNATEIALGESAGTMVNATDDTLTQKITTPKKISKWALNLTSIYYNKSGHDIQKYPLAGKMPFNGPCANDCNQNGRCLIDMKNKAKMRCYCIAGWRGQFCQINIEQERLENQTRILKNNPFASKQKMGCMNGCTGHGVCIDGKCVCDSDWGGKDCSEFRMDPSKLKRQKFELGKWPLLFVGIIILILFALFLCGVCVHFTIDQDPDRQRANVGSAEDQKKFRAEKAKKKGLIDKVWTSWRWRSIHMHRKDPRKKWADKAELPADQQKAHDEEAIAAKHHKKDKSNLLSAII